MCFLWKFWNVIFVMLFYLHSTEQKDASFYHIFVPRIV